jgi:hypothetical protein
MMTLDAAREQLEFHCGAEPRIDDPRWKDGLLSTLRPYAGLRLDVLANVTECVDAVADHLRTTSHLDRRIVSSLWAIVHLTRAWALEPDGMLKRNHLITDEDAATLESWVSDLSYQIFTILDGNG